MQKISEANRKFWIRNKSTSRNRSFPHHLLTYLLSTFARPLLLMMTFTHQPVVDTKNNDLNNNLK